MRRIEKRSWLGRCAILLAVGCPSLGVQCPADETAEPHLLRRMESEFIAVYEKVAPAVVVVEARKSPDASGGDVFSFRDEAGELFPLPKNKGWSEGSGFVVASDGLVVTNSHVIEGAVEVVVRFKDGRRLRGQLAGKDPRTDIALLRVAANGLAAVEFGDSDGVRVGQLVCAIGAPYQLDYSFTCGWVSGIGRTNLTETNFEDYIQTDAFINPGNSGGPLFDVDGRVIGMNTLIRGIGRGLSFAIPGNLVKDIAGALAREGKVRRPWIGVRVEALERSGLAQLPDVLEPGTSRGVVVHTIFPDSPALRADVRPSDILLSLDDVPLATPRDLQREIYRKPVGEEVVLSLMRGRRRVEVTIRTAEMPESGEESGARELGVPVPRSGDTIGVHGFELGELPQALAEQLGLRGASGVLVEAVIPGSMADRAGFTAGDVILAVDRSPVSGPSECLSAFSDRSLKRGCLVEFEHQGMRRYAVLGGPGAGAGGRGNGEGE